jgi:hypothetical protein
MFGYNPQITAERIDSQIAQLQQMKTQLPQANAPTAINQTFQLAPTSASLIRYVNSLDDVNKELIIGETPFFSKDMSVLWVKDTKGIRTYELKEIIPKDEKDIQIEFLQAEIEKLKKGMINNEQSDTNDISTKIESNPTRDDESVGTTTKKSKSSSI